MTRRTRAAVVAARATISAAFAARTAIAIAAAESAAIATAAAFTRTARSTLVASASSRKLFLGRRRKQRLARQTDLAGIGLDGDDLHFHFVAHLEEVRHLADA